jgi:hypothetical protein
MKEAIMATMKQEIQNAVQAAIAPQKLINAQQKTEIDDLFVCIGMLMLRQGVDLPQSVLDKMNNTSPSSTAPTTPVPSPVPFLNAPSTPLASNRSQPVPYATNPATQGRGPMVT